MERHKVKNMNMKEYSGLSSDKTTNVKEAVPIHLKMTLTIKEAAEYSNIGINKIDALLKQPNCPFVLFVGNKSWSSAGHLRSLSVPN